MQGNSKNKLVGGQVEQNQAKTKFETARQSKLSGKRIISFQVQLFGPDTDDE